MSDILIDLDVLSRVRGDLKHIGEILERPGREMDGVDGDAMGVGVLASRMNEFGDEWAYGIKQIKKYSGAAVKVLDQMKKAFDDLDRKLDEELRKSQKGCA
ncbi:MULTISPECIES: hypothetical protein [unclassified Streptomyces]|uniref:hypothetical protein n=1 Tax=unclassified Streptomyces TaxID=2593676 RepID=UPI00343BB11D